MPTLERQAARTLRYPLLLLLLRRRRQCGILRQGKLRLPGDRLQLHLCGLCRPGGSGPQGGVPSADHLPQRCDTRPVHSEMKEGVASVILGTQQATCRLVRSC